ncbi:MAG: PorT family protein [Flavobacteriales bacterium]|nr:PorT family protein [Flavobacteriales bacterium]
MKIINKTILTTFFAILISSLLSAQTVKKVAIGLYGSGNVSWLKPDIDGKYGYSRKGVGLGYSAGVALDFALFGSNNYAFVTGVGVLYHSGKLTYPDVYSSSSGAHYAGTTTSKYMLSYIDIPIMLKLKTNEIGYLTYYGEVGSSFGIKYKARADWNGTYDGDTELITSSSDDADVTTETNLFRFPLIIGAGAEYNLSGNTSIVIGIIYNNGFTNAFSWGGKNNPDVYDVNDEGGVLLDTNGDVILDANGVPTTTDIKRKAISNFIGLKVGIKF